MTMINSMKQTLMHIWAYEQRRPAIVMEGTRALNRLIPTALSYTAQGQVIGRFLLGLYDGAEYRFALPQLYRLGLKRFEDCMRVLNMDYAPEVEVHERIEGGGDIWRQLISQWGTLRPQQPAYHFHGVSAQTYNRYRKTVEHDGLQAFQRLIHIAQNGTGQSHTITAFLMGLVNNSHLRMNLTNLRLLDLPVFEDCVSVLRLGYLTKTEEHHLRIVTILHKQVFELETEVGKP